jgi:hypothetical protein
MMLLWMRRKTRALEKVENLYRTATAQKKLSSTIEQIEHARSIFARSSQTALRACHASHRERS